MPPLIDTHCHLTHARLASRMAEVLESAWGAGLVGCIVAAASVPESVAAAELASSDARLWCMAGVHPHEAEGFDAASAGEIRRLAAGDRCVAVGEIGLDYHHDYSPRPAQREAFAAQLEIARELGKPVAIHTREAFEDTLAVLSGSGVAGEKVLFHSFTEGPQAARRVLDLGACISYSGIVTFRNGDLLRESAALTPLDRMMVETDAPYLSPEPVRKIKTNEPAHVAHIARFLAKLRGVSLDDLAAATTANARRFFGLG